MILVCFLYKYKFFRRFSSKKILDAPLQNVNKLPARIDNNFALFQKNNAMYFFLDHNDVGENNTGIRYDNVLKTDVLWKTNYVKSQRVRRYEHATQ